MEWRLRASHHAIRRLLAATFSPFFLSVVNTYGICLPLNCALKHEFLLLGPGMMYLNAAENVTTCQ